ncbi:hypothetical protein FOVSG1_012341 [Fusarium oxysporum f. sp. vasinfectum]
MRIDILGTAASTVLLGLNTVPVQALRPCPLFGPDLLIPTALSDDVSIRNALSEILQLVPSLDIDFQNTSFSIDIYPAADQRPLFSYHHSAPTLQKHGHGFQAVNDTTVYRIGSISKLLTAYVYLLEVGDVSFNQPVTRYVPELADISARLRNKSASALQYVDWDAITIGALASHMAGIPRDFPSPASADRQLARLGFPPVRAVDFAYCGKSVLYPCNRTAFFDAIRTRHPVEAAFSTPIYSNIGYQIMAYALENITGTTYPDILSRQLILSLGLNSTSYAKPANTDSSIIPDSPSSSWYDVDTRDEGPAAGIYSSIADLRRIGQSILTYEMLSPSQTRRWMKPLSFTADPQVAVGAPWEIARVTSTTNRASWMYTKGGQLGMYSSLMALLPDWGVGLTVLAAGTGASGVVGMIPGAMVSKLVPALEQAAKRQARQSYSGRYGDERNGMMVAVQDSLPGLGVTSWFFGGRDMFDSIRLIVSGSSTGSGNVSMRFFNFLTVAMNTTTSLPNSIEAMGFSPLLAPNAIFLSFYSILLLLHVLIALRFWRFFGYSIGMVCGILLELVGYCGKVQLSHNRDNKDGYIMYIIGLTLGPTFLSSALYLNISTLQQRFSSSQFTRISPRLFASLFIIGDFICLCFIGCGGSLAAIFAENPIGVDLMITGLAVQVLFTTIFCLALWAIYHRAWHDILQEKRHLYVIGLAVASACLFVRSCWRCAELSGGFNGPLASMEGVFFALDSVPIVVMTVTLTILHPEFWLRACKASSGKLVCAGNYSMEYVQTKD